jgi:ABC-type dipeptide/oligopeptide/nickel transport system permease subunit
MAALAVGPTIRLPRLRPGEWAGVLFLAAFAFVAVFAPWITPFDPLAQDLNNALALPTLQHLLGTDDLGRDILSRLMLGTRVSVEVGFGSALLALLVGATLGLWAAYRPGIVAGTIMRISDVLLAFPAVLLAMIVATVLHTGSIGVLLAIALISVPSFVRLAYAIMLAQRHQQYVEAAEAFGASSLYIVFRSVLPNALGPLAVQTAFTVANAVLLEAGLSFLGLGIQPPTPSLGLMLQEARAYIRTDAWFGVCPGLTIVAMVLALNAVADNMARRADPRGAARRLRHSGV